MRRFFKDEMHELIGWNVYNFPREMERQGVMCSVHACIVIQIADRRYLKNFGSCRQSMDQAMTCVKHTLNYFIFQPPFQ